MRAFDYSVCKDNSSDAKAYSTSIGSPSVQCAIRVALTIASLLAYATLVLNLNQTLVPPSYSIEREPIAVAVSHLVYRAPLATEFEGLRNLFVTGSSSMPDKLAVATQRKIVLGRLLQHSLDGLGVGYSLYVTVAMRVFGVSLIALTAGFLCLQGLAVLVFLLRFRDNRSLIVSLYFFALSAILATSIGTNANGHIPVGGYRYFSLLAVIPALHIALELVDESAGLPPLRGIVPLSLQALLLTCAYIINGSVIYVVLPVLGIVVAIAIFRRKNSKRLISAMKKCSYAIATSLVVYMLFYASAREHFNQSGAIGDTFWHRIFISYGASPVWPFGNLHDVYSACEKDIPGGLAPGIVDQNGNCVWETYAIQNGLSSVAMRDGFYSPEYERVMRDAFVKVLFAYPREAIRTFLFYKPLMITTTLGKLFRPMSSVGLLREIVLFVQTLLLVGFAFFGLAPSPAGRLVLMAGVIALFGASTLALYIAAWSNLATTADLICYLFMLAGLFLVATIVGIGTAAAHFRRPKASGMSTQPP